MHFKEQLLRFEEDGNEWVLIHAVLKLTQESIINV